MYHRTMLEAQLLSISKNSNYRDSSNVILTFTIAFCTYVHVGQLLFYRKHLRLFLENEKWTRFSFYLFSKR